MYIKNLNQKSNKKSFLKDPERYNMDVSDASMFLHLKAFSEYFGTDMRCEKISKYKSENPKIVILLEKFTAQKAKIVDKTSFKRL